MYEPENQKYVIMNEIERIKENSNIVVLNNVFSFVGAHPINEKVAPIEELINWVKSVR